MNKIIIDEQFLGQRLDKFATAYLKDNSRSFIKNLIDEGNILVNSVKVKAGYLLKVGDEIVFKQTQPIPIEAKAQDVDFKIVYEDSDLIVVDKPQGLVVHPCQSTKDGTLVNGLLAKVKDLSGINGKLRPGIVHRLDKNTSGLMLVAKNDFSHIELANMIKNKTVSRKYLALLEGTIWENEGVIENYLGRDKHNRKKYAVCDKGKLAISKFNVVQRFQNFTLVEFSLVTGRTHQIRVHSSFIGHPVVGDDLYGSAVKGLKGQLLHSYKLSFIHPRTHKLMEFASNLPEYFQNFIAKLKEFEN